MHSLRKASLVVASLLLFPPLTHLQAMALRATEGLRQELAGKIRVSVIMPGFTDTAFLEHVKSPELKKQMKEAGERFAMSPETVARAIAYVIDQPDEVNIGEVILRSTAQA